MVISTPSDVMSDEDVRQYDDPCSTFFLPASLSGGAFAVLHLSVVQ